MTEGGVTSTLATYTWLADGTKYSTERPDGSGYVYKGELIYTKAPDGALTLDCVLTTGGRIVAERDTDGTLSGYSVRHHIRDHLGSVRAVTDGSTGEVLETSDYLPFGTRWALTGGTQGATSTITDPSNRWRYSGKEEQQALSPALSLLDYGARMYDPTLARWLTPDPLAEKQYQSDPYSFCYANPVIVIDKDGRYGETLWDVLNVVMDVKSLASNIKDGHVGSALVDAVGLVYDVAAVALPLVPAGAGTAMNALRKGDDVVDAAKVVHGNSKLSTEAQHAFINNNSGKSVGIPSSSVQQTNKKQTGSYTITFESGNKYHGKGGEQRMRQSAREKAREYEDQPVSFDWTPADNTKEAFIQEAVRIDNDGGPRKKNYNKINSPGYKYIKTD
ncbi:MAG: RHS repeat-associated core domain-containing protein [Bacteroidales bacterium]|nr:RHS repeat-associated core domain-containing protein [Bacteroidales bacterium]